ncbi:kyphoscoliosis peptidase [Notechis scutatus]|uniref:Kyphoscoliosis peptidase n=1 Tax=Notechis scutatus TaxID=8663 RepID=A0A6J1TZS2_9SAUR|nr:kyphoscoliosis peptidase [Notechis scutatus]
MGTMEFPNVHSAVALEMLLVVQSAKRHTTAVRKLREEKQGGSLVLQQNQGCVFCKKQVITTCSPQGTQVTVEVHNSNSTPQLFKNISSEKGFQVKPRPPEPKDQHAYPWDKSCLKSMPLDLKQFEKLDAYAEKVNAKSNVKELVENLLRVAHTDLEKVRAIWIWISHHIEYDVVGYFNTKNVSLNPQDVLQSGKSICAGYASLFEEMCRIAGIRCMNLSGYAKGRGYKAGQTFKGDSNHAWNAVYLDGKWHLVDSTWGSGYVDECNNTFTFRYDEFYFLTHPALFINDHFPDNSNWQLLKPTVAFKQFEKNMKYHSNFYTMGLLVAHPETPIIQTVNGKVTIVVEGSSPMLFMTELKRAKEYSLMTLKKNGMKLELYPQQMGTHELQIFAKSPEGSYDFILEYIIECSSIDTNVCFPKELNQPVGPNWFTKKQGILKPSQKGPVIHTNDGCCNLSFILSEDLDILPSLRSDSISPSKDVRTRHILQQRQGNQINFKIHLPHAGNFAFCIFAKKKSDPGNYDYIFNYLICCPNTKVKWPMFPLMYSDWAEDYELVEPLAAFLPANCNIKFKLKLHSIAKAFVKCEKECPLSLSKDGYWEGSCSTSGCREIYVMVLENTNHNYSYILKYEVESQ